VHAGQATKTKIDQRLNFHRDASRRQLADIVQTPISDGMLEAQRGYFVGEPARGDGIPDLNESLLWREMVAELMFSRTSQKSIEIGLGLDLWHIIRTHRWDSGRFEILGTNKRRKKLGKSGPFLVQQLALNQFWKNR
jgi:hypothetical protein